MADIEREAMHNWKLKRELRLDQLAELRVDIDRGLADVAADRVHAFDAKRIITRGKQLLEDR